MGRTIDADDAIYMLNKIADIDNQPRAIRRAAKHLSRFADEYAKTTRVSEFEWIPAHKPPEEDGTYLAVRNTYIGIPVQGFFRFANNLRDVSIEFPEKEGWYDWRPDKGYFLLDMVTHWAFPPEFPSKEEEDDE